jgi:DUF917 family protein
MRLLGKQEIEDIAIGSAVLGTGGGGDPYLGKLVALQAIEKYGPLQLIEVEELNPDTLVVFPFGLGAPVPFLERITILDDIDYAYQALEKFLGKKVGAMMSIEIGGMNSVVPFALAAKLGLPLIDGDGMGRAFPQVQLVTFTMYGHSASPMAVGDERGNVVVFDTVDNFWMERLARPIAVQYGAISGGVGFPMKAGDIVESGVLGTVSFAERIGAAIRTAHEEHTDAIEAVTGVTNGFAIFSGRIVDVQRRVERGWTLGEVTILGTDDCAGRQVTIQFQNENLVVLEGSEALVSVPDLITVIDTERGEPITTENLRYGFRVTVLAIPCDEKWRTPAGLALAGPDHWGYDVKYVPVEERFGNSSRQLSVVSR